MVSLVRVQYEVKDCRKHVPAAGVSRQNRLAERTKQRHTHACRSNKKLRYFKRRHTNPSFFCVVFTHQIDNMNGEKKR